MNDLKSALQNTPAGDAGTSLRETAAAICFYSSLMIYSFLAILLTIISLSFVLQIPLSGYQLICSIICAPFVQIGYLQVGSVRGKRNVFSLSTVIFAVLVCCTLLLSYRFYDISWDGQAYHQEMILQLNEGWNPYSGDVTYQQSPHQLYINHYAKGAEYIGAGMYAATGLIETAKAPTMLLMIATALFAIALLLRYTRFHPGTAASLGILLAANPVALVQYFTFYNDGWTASLLTTLVLLLSVIYKFRTASHFPLIVSLIVLLVNTKFSAFIYCAIIVFGFLLILLTKRKYKELKRVIAASFFGFSIGIFLVGYNPYIRNTVEYGHPFYPLMGTVDIVTPISPKDWNSKSGLEKTFLSIFSRTEDVRSDRTSSLKIPFTILYSELTTVTNPGVSIGGFGALFGGIVILTGLLFVILLFSGKQPREFYLILTLILLTIIFNPLSWYARYTPQIWMIPIIVLAASYHFSGRLVKIIRYSLLTAIITNCFLITAAYTAYNVKASISIKKELSALKSSSQPIRVCFDSQYGGTCPFRSLRARFKEHGVEFIEVKSPTEFQNSANVKYIGYTYNIVRAETFPDEGTLH